VIREDRRQRADAICPEVCSVRPVKNVFLLMFELIMGILDSPWVKGMVL